MTTITEDYVSFETAELLKDKGFDGRCYKVWEKRYGSEPTILAAPVFVEGETTVDRESVDSAAKYMVNIYSLHNRVDGYLAPTLQMAMKWLREEHSIIIIVEPHIFNPQEGRTTQFRFSVWVEDNYEDPYFDDPEHQFDSFSTYEKTCDVAIKYCLTNLV